MTDLPNASPMKTSLTKTARAKINVTLHVGAVQSGGYHPLHSIVAFADYGDELTINAHQTQMCLDDPLGTVLTIEGPFSRGLSGAAADNLILRASALFDGPSREKWQRSGISTSADGDQSFVGELVEFNLIKNLPVSSGIGGGSADAAAAIHLRCACGHSLSADFMGAVHKMGADIAVCLSGETCLMQGIGEDLTPIDVLGSHACVLVNCNQPLSTKAVFERFDMAATTKKNGLQTDLKQVERDFNITAKQKPSLLALAQSGRNDLQEIAIQIVPQIQTVLDEILIQTGCQLARMSGSGTTCFGLFENDDLAVRAARAIQSENPNWWVVASRIG